MVHIIFPVTWAALLHYYLPILPAVEWDFAAPRPPPLPKVSYQSGGGNSYSSISSLNDWLSPASSPFSLHSRVVRACTWKYSCGENGQARSHKPTGLFSRSQLGLLLPLRLIVRVCAGPIPLFNFKKKCF